MNRTIILMTLVTSAAWLLLAAQQPLPGVMKTGAETVLQGRIVLYDWASHETTANDDFVIKTADSNAPYARVIYKPLWGFDAPPVTQKAVLDRWAFVGRGPSWNFAVHKPLSVEEKAACSSPIVNHKFEDESGSGEIQRYIATPGADTANTLPIQSLPCFILRPGGLARADTMDARTRNLHPSTR